MAKGAKKSDRARERWRRIVDDWRGSGLGVRAFCRERGLSEHSLYAWRRRLGDGKPARAVMTPGFLPVRVVSRGAPAGGIEVELPSGRVVRAGAGVEPEALARLVSLLDPRPC